MRPAVMEMNPEIVAVRRAALERGQKLKLPYVGALLPADAYTLMQAGARLVDIRTQAEIYWVGRIPGTVAVEWNSYPGGVLNLDFVKQLSEFIVHDEPVMFICRSGGRSHHAAMAATQAGFTECYNVLEGFEGNRDAGQHRNTIGGWRAAGLPWVQG